jgi:hypothetical protein
MNGASRTTRSASARFCAIQAAVVPLMETPTPQPVRKGDGFVGGVEHGLGRKRPELVSHQVGLSMSGRQWEDNIMAALEKDSPELVELLGGIGQPLEEDEDVFGGLIVEEGPRAAGLGEGLWRAGEQFFERDFRCVVIGGRRACGNGETARLHSWRCGDL